MAIEFPVSVVAGAGSRPRRALADIRCDAGGLRSTCATGHTGARILAGLVHSSLHIRRGGVAVNKSGVALALVGADAGSGGSITGRITGGGASGGGVRVDRVAAGTISGVAIRTLANIDVDALCIKMALATGDTQTLGGTPAASRVTITRVASVAVTNIWVGANGILVTATARHTSAAHSAAGVGSPLDTIARPAAVARAD